MLSGIENAMIPSIGKKAIVAGTGMGLFLFVFGHMAGNLQFFLGRETLNKYGELLHWSPEALWLVRLGLLTFVVVHILTTIKLQRENQRARPVGYVKETTIRAGRASRAMLLSGLMVLLFIIYHLLHFTAQVAPADYQTLYEYKPTGEPILIVSSHSPSSAKSQETLVPQTQDGNPFVAGENTDWSNHAVKTDLTRHDVYGMVRQGFRVPLIALVYILAQLLLALHLNHGASSMFQTLGWNSPKYQRALALFGPVISIVICLGFISVPIAIQLDYWTGFPGFTP